MSSDTIPPQHALMAPDASTVSRILDELSRTGIDLLLEEPFFAHLFAGINKEVVGGNHEVQTLAVGVGHSTTYTLYVNADFWNEVLTLPAQRRGVVKHEMLHLVFRHLLVREPAFDGLLMNIAFDLVVNQYVKRSDLPDDSIFLESFPDLRLRPGQTWFYYYKKIEDTRKSKGGSEQGKASEEMLQNIQSDSYGMERHQPWKEIKSTSELESAVLDTHLDSLMRTAHQRTNAAAWGHLPAGVQEALQHLFARSSATLNWRTVIRSFSASARTTRLRNTIKRASKRYGTTPGIRISRRQKILIALDTSGSIGTEELDLFFSEIRHIWRTGSEIEVVECDTEIHNRYPYLGKTPPLIKGRGGTDFTEVLQLANKEKPDALIYFTDGFAGVPTLSMRIPVLWLISPGGLHPAQPGWGKLPGRKVKMNG